MKNLLKLVFTTCCVLSSTGVLASDTVPLGSIRMHMRSSQDSDEENFRIRVLSQTFLVRDVNRTLISAPISLFCKVTNHCRDSSILHWTVPRTSLQKHVCRQF